MYMAPVLCCGALFLCKICCTIRSQVENAGRDRSFGPWPHNEAFKVEYVNDVSMRRFCNNTDRMPYMRGLDPRHASQSNVACVWHRLAKVVSRSCTCITAR